jgi:acetolactate synthase-1/2/3 large subunit
MTIERSGAEILIEAMTDLGVEVIFGYPGGAVLPIYDALFKQKRIRHILVRQEGGAAHAAEGYARATGKPGVVLVTSGPGATNTITGIADAMMDSIPMVVITGQVPTALIGTDAFQECDTIGITRHCTKHNYLVKDPAKLGDVVHEAFHIATSGRPGPVVIDLPKDVQVASASYRRPGSITTHRSYRPQVKADVALIESAVEMLAAAERPILYTGGGIINSGPGASQMLRELQRLSGAPVTSTLMGLGCFPSSHPDFLGMLGMHGTYEANHAMHHADLILCLGARFDDRVTGRLDAFSPRSKKIHVDIDRSSINKKSARSRIVGVSTPWRQVKLWKGATPRQDPRHGSRASTMARQALARFPASDTWRSCPSSRSTLVRGTYRRNPIITIEVGPAPDVGGTAFRVRDSRTSG